MKCGYLTTIAVIQGAEGMDKLSPAALKKLISVLKVNLRSLITPGV
jgi:hypothetical protein